MQYAEGEAVLKALGTLWLAPVIFFCALCTAYFCVKLGYKLKNIISNGSENSKLTQVLNDWTVSPANGLMRSVDHS